jgi:hypothetical protein
MTGSAWRDISEDAKSFVTSLLEKYEPLLASSSVWAESECIESKGESHRQGVCPQLSCMSRR